MKSETTPAADESDDVVSGDPIKVLHVEDDPDFADLAATFLEQENDRFTVETARDATEGLDRVGDGFDCVVSDYDMPGPDGIEFLEAVREHRPDLPFILFTGKGSEEVASDAISAGVTDYLQKGGGTDQYAVLGNRIENAVAKHRAEKLVNRAFKAMDTAREGISLLDRHGKFIFVNQAYADTVGYESEALVGEHWETVYPDDQIDRLYDEILPAIPEEGHWTGECVHQRGDGGRVLVEQSLAYSEHGTMICLLRNLTTDETRRKELKEERQRFQLFVDAVEEYGIFMLDSDGYITTWNEGAERLKGYTEDEILGDHFSTFYTDAQRERGLPKRMLETAIEEGSAEHQGPRVRKDGTTFLADVVITAVYDEDGEHRGFGKVTRDISDRSP